MLTVLMHNETHFAISPAASSARVLKTRLEADQWAFVIARIINDLRTFGHTSHDQLAAELNRRGIPTVRNGSWHRTTVQKPLKRYAFLRASIRSS